MIGQISTSLLWICGKSMSNMLSRKYGHTIMPKYDQKILCVLLSSDIPPGVI
jgi:hypothetical protein